MSKTVPQLKKIDRTDGEKVETISTPYAWQQQKPAAPNSDAAKAEQHIKTVPVSPTRKRAR